jgi:DNA (cytosine-5)-methyltransferase 1
MPSKSKEPNPIRFIDLFAGIGGFHLAFHSRSVQNIYPTECVFVSEWDNQARSTYETNFKKLSPRIFAADSVSGEQLLFAGDITEVEPDAIPDFEVLCGGFPCQPFSQVGLRKGMDEARGTLFFDIIRILKTKKPEAYFLENVRGLLNHQSGDVKTISIIESQLMGLGYTFDVFLVKASDHGVPQHRPRLFMVGFKDKSVHKKFMANLPEPKKLKKNMSDIMGGKVDREVGFTLRVGGRGSGVHDRRNWDAYLVNGKQVVLTKEHGLAMQGFPRSFKFPSNVSESQAMKQLGNSVAVPAIEAYAKAIVFALRGE